MVLSRLVQLTDALRKYVDERASDKDVCATPSEYIRDLIRQHMQRACRLCRSAFGRT